MTNDERYAAIKVLLDGNHPVTLTPYDVDNAIALGQINDPTVEIEKLTTPLEAANATDGTEFNSVNLSDIQRQQWLTVLGWDAINLNAGIGLETATGMWNSGNTEITKAALIATRTKLTGHSDSEGLGNCSIGDIQNARAL